MNIKILSAIVLVLVVSTAIPVGAALNPADFAATGWYNKANGGPWTGPAANTPGYFAGEKLADGVEYE